jgi:L-iditol 2-dehydrogenase
MLEPLSVGLHACKRGNITIGHTVLITGAGPIGLMCMLAARAAGATTIVITDLAANRLEAGKKLGADVIFRAGPEGDGDLVEAIRSGKVPTPDVTIEASGAQTGIATAIQVCGCC